MTEIKGVLFDLDGVILDTEGIYTRFWDAVEERYPTHIPNFSSVIKGSNLYEILHDYYADEHTRQLVTNMLNEFQVGMKYEYFPGVESFIQELNAANIPLCVVTSSDNAKIAAVCAQHPGFKEQFDAIVTGESVSRAKPDPECFLLGAKLINCEPSQCLIFEDSIKGLKAARAAGGCVVGVSTTNPKEVVAEYSHIVIETFKTLSLSKLNELL